MNTKKELEEKELMINDLVYGIEYRYNEETDKEEYINHPVRITDISSNGALQCDFGNGECSFLADYLDDSSCEELTSLEPIPITEEILKINNFIDHGFFMTMDLDWSVGDIKKIDYKANYVSMVKWSHEDDLKIFACGIVVDNVCKVNVNIKYIHELQHLLRISGLKDLADNFKIR